MRWAESNFLVYNNFMAKARVAINGFGRIGRLFFRQAFGVSDLDIVAINDLGDAENLAYLLKYDTVYGRYGKDVEVRGGKQEAGGSDAGGSGKLVVDGREIAFL